MNSLWYTMSLDMLCAYLRFWQYEVYGSESLLGNMELYALREVERRSNEP